MEKKQPSDQPFISSGLEIAKRNNCRGVNFVFKGLMLPVFCFEFAWRSALGCWRCFCTYMRRTQFHVARIASRVVTTSHGSSNDIGWLQCDPGMAPVEDGWLY